MSDTRNRDNVNLEKHLPDAVLKIAYRSIAFWSIIRIQVLNQLTVKVKSKDSAMASEHKVVRLATKVWRFFEEVLRLFRFIWVVVSSRDIEVILRVNSYSVAGEREGRVSFTNGNLQEIYDELLKNKVKCLVVVNDQSRYKLQNKLTAAIVYPLLLPLVIRNIVRVLNRRTVSRIVNVLCENVTLERQRVQKLISSEIAVLSIWEVVYKYITPKIVYYDFPHNCFESEVVAAKLNNIKTIEIFHGGITQDEPSYFLRHLNYDGLVHSVCDEFLSPSENQTEFLRANNDKYKTITTINFKPALSLSVKHKRELLKMRNGSAGNKRKILFVTSITDYDVNDVSNYIEKNLSDLRDNFSTISLRLYRADSKDRWQSLLDAYQFIELSNLTLSEDIESSDVLVVVSPTVMLQLKALDIEYVDLSRSAI